MKKIKLYLYSSVVALFILFILQNIQTDIVSFLFWDFSMPRAVLLLFTLCLGMIMGALIPFAKLLPKTPENKPS
ncbi:MAG: putative membrane protein [Paraglaciecola sp.]|jgi:putative membrane protein